MVPQNDHLVFTISDNGKGFDTSKGASKTLGLLGMKERTQGMGGQYNISSVPRQGYYSNCYTAIHGNSHHSAIAGILY